MTYSEGHPIRLIGGRLALDFINTADWSHDERVVNEKIAAEADLASWLGALEMGGVTVEPTLQQLLAYRLALRRLFTGSGDPVALNAVRDIEITSGTSTEALATGQGLRALLAISALSILMDDRERRRLKMCPGDNCGWLFIDDTKNA